MKGKVVGACAIVAVHGIISAAAGFAAEVTRVKPSEVHIEQFSCVYPSSPALGFGILAGIFAIATRIVLLMLVGCCCCCRSGSTSTPLSNMFSILSWLATVVAVILLFGGAVLNNRESGQKDYDGSITCYVVKPGILAAGAVFSLLAAIFGIVVYVSESSAKQTTPRLQFALPVVTNVDLEKNVPGPAQQ
ncbi:hypothetical protein L1987_56296 [Smallanthus sonchifolius]|uniref:Uncharacterized protein n=1 Tax=Smallanthus sonchifolius TaxID=185202 RepID=A0ACB9ECQ6_9ASTR|nr:hypothetical protein L1987_56296 [Smallanthus sonchifolius]